jgi:glutamyl-tRNA reductase
MLSQLFAFGVNFNVKSEINSTKLTLDSKFLQQELGNESISFVTLNTCNRNEIYGTGNVHVAREIVFDKLKLSEAVKASFFTYQGEEALYHIFEVVSGLNSQIIGDNEVSGQYRGAFLEAKSQNSVSGFLEKMTNLCLQSAKEIKTTTQLSGGTRSVSYATIKHILNLKLLGQVTILVVGTGMIGRAVVKNVKEYIPQAELFISNRTRQNAELFFAEMGDHLIDFEDLPSFVNRVDVIVSCITANEKPIFDENFNWPKKTTHIIDLGVPSSMSPNLLSLPQLHIADINIISKELIATLEMRSEAVPLARAIMEKHIAEFINWSKVYESKDAIKEWHESFERASQKCPFIKELGEDSKATLKHKSTATLVKFIRDENHEVPKQDSIIERYKVNVPTEEACSSAEDCIKNKFNCNICNNN